MGDTLLELVKRKLATRVAPAQERHATLTRAIGYS
jgi:hypothetical protein